MENNGLTTITNSNSEKILQYIVVKIGNEQYGIDISFVDNIVRMQNITRVPKAQEYYRGVINLRGEIIPVMSLRLKLGLESDQFSNKTRIIIIKIDNTSVGMIVDEVKEVVNLSEEDMESVSHDAVDGKEFYISAIGKSNGELVSILDVRLLLIEKGNA